MDAVLNARKVFSCEKAVKEGIVSDMLLKGAAMVSKITHSIRKMRGLSMQLELQML